MATKIWVNIGSGNGLLPDGTKPLPEPMLTDHQWSPVTFILGQFHKRCLNHQSLKSVWKLIKSKISFKFPRGQWVIIPLRPYKYLENLVEDAGTVKLKSYLSLGPVNIFPNFSPWWLIQWFSSLIMHLQNHSDNDMWNQRCTLITCRYTKKKILCNAYYM